LSSINFEAVEAAAISPIHALAETAVVGVAVVVRVVRGVRVTGGLLVGASHSFIPFLYLYIIINFVTNQVIVLLHFCYKIAGRPEVTFQ
jgi:hypothetical protein